MKCREAQYWLHSFQPNAAWPLDVVGHLQDCPACQQLQAQLRQIDQGINHLTSLPPDGAPVAQLLKRISETPQTPVANAPAPKPAWPWVRVGSYLAAAVALIALGWLLGRGSNLFNSAGNDPIKTVEVFRDVVRDKIVNSPADRILFSMLLKRNARLVQSSSSDDRVETLLDMADDCRQHAWTLIEQGPRDSLPMTLDLYTQLLTDGVLVQIAQAPEKVRPALQTTVKARLEKMAEPPASAPKSLPAALSDQRDVMQNATRQTLQRVDRPEETVIKPRPKKIASTEPMPPAMALVQFALTVSSETDPVVKADLCADYVNRLMPSMRLYLAEDTVPQRAEMGQQFGELIQFGVYGPLEADTAKEPEAPVKVETDRIRQSAAQAVAEMEANMKKAPEDARQGWERALEASKKGFERNKAAPKGKGPAGKDKGKGPREVNGILKNVDTVNQTITVTAKVNGKDGEFTYNLAQDILAGFRAAADKQAGMRLHLLLSDDRRTVIDISRSNDRNEQGEKESK